MEINTLLAGILSLTMMSGQEVNNKVVTQTIGKKVEVGQIVEINTSRASVMGSIGTCWPAISYDSVGNQKVKMMCN